MNIHQLGELLTTKLEAATCFNFEIQRSTRPADAPSVGTDQISSWLAGNDFSLLIGSNFDALIEYEETYPPEVVTNVKARSSSPTGMFEEEELDFVWHDRVLVIARTYYETLLIPRPLEGDIMIDLDHGQKRYKVVPDGADRAFRLFGANKTSFQILMKRIS